MRFLVVLVALTACLPALEPREARPSEAFLTIVETTEGEYEVTLYLGPHASVCPPRGDGCTLIAILAPGVATDARVCRYHETNRELLLCWIDEPIEVGYRITVTAHARPLASANLYLASNPAQLVHLRAE